MSSTKKKRYILDTSVLLHDPEALFKFKDNEVHIPEIVLQELDKKKNSPGIIGKNSRQVTRHLDKLSLQYFDSLPNIPLHDDGGCLVLGAGAGLSALDGYGDVKLIEYSQQCPGAIVVSKDLGLRVAARTRGILAEDYRNERVEAIYTGHRSVCCESDDELMELWADPNKSIFVDSLGDLTLKQLKGLTHNECVTLMGSTGRHALTRYDESKNRLSVISTHNGLKVTGIQPLNSEQKYALELLLDPKVTMMSLVGQAGSGKTLLALAAALHQCQNLGLYETIIIGRKEVGVGDKPPWLPGNIKEKTDPWLAGLYGCLNQLAKTDKSQKNRMVGLNPYDIYLKSDTNPDGPVETVSLAYIRGVTWRNSIIVLDEMQNVPPAEAKTIATRIGEGSKLILLGDVEQIDQEAAKFMDEFSNGLAVTTERMRGYSGFAHLTLLDSVRSELARAVAQRMK